MASLLVDPKEGFWSEMLINGVLRPEKTDFVVLLEQWVPQEPIPTGSFHQ